MIYITGDIHGNPWTVFKFARRNKLTQDDIIVIPGDVGANYYGNEHDEEMKDLITYHRPTVLCVHGNHEMRPWEVEGYHLIDWMGGKVWVQDKHPKLLFAKDGEVYTIDGLRFMPIGGAYSVDKFYRLQRGFGWWADEQPSEETKRKIEAVLSARKDIDIILSHTCPKKYIPTEMFLPMIDQSLVDNSTEEWLDTIEDTVNYKAWYCGHWHTDKRIDKMHFLFTTFESLGD